MSEKIIIGSPEMPELHEVIPYLNEIWNTRTLTNVGKFHQELEQRIADYLGVKYVSLYNNCTIATYAALKVLQLKGEVVTTPYSFAATTNAIRLAGLKPIFVDIKPDTFNINAELIEKNLTKQASAILAVHVYGTPCDNGQLLELATRHNLSLLYDGAHAFGTFLDGKSILSWGDLSVVSFHATKIFNTFEGGAIITNCPSIKEKVDAFRNFGLCDNGTIERAGLNGKMSELHAVVGLLQLENFEKIRTKRQKIHDNYIQYLHNLKKIDIDHHMKQKIKNISYFPVLVRGDGSENRNKLFNFLSTKDIYTRKYFHPLLSSIYNSEGNKIEYDLPVASEINQKILCLPIHSHLSDKDQKRVINAILEFEKL